MRFLLIIALAFGAFLFQDEILKFWNTSDIAQKVDLQNLSPEDIETKMKHLKAQVVDLKGQLETRTEEGVEKAKEIRDALIEAQTALNDFQSAVHNLQESGARVKAAVVE